MILSVSCVMDTEWMYVYAGVLLLGDDDDKCMYLDYTNFANN